MNKKIQSALISVFYKDGLEPVVKTLHDLGISIYSTGGTQSFNRKTEYTRNTGRKPHQLPLYLRRKGKDPAPLCIWGHSWPPRQ